MMLTHSFKNRFVAFAFGLVLLLMVGAARADPPARVARLGYISGAVSFSPSGASDWMQATLNWPLTTGDRLWADSDARAELQIGGAAIRLGSSTSLTIISLDDKTAQLELSQGSLSVFIRQMGRDQSFEVDTPKLAFSLHEPGDYRIDVDASGAATTVKVKLGQTEVYGDRTSYTVTAGQAYRFYGAGLSDYVQVSAAADDDLDRWSREREVRTANSDSARYVAYDVVGFEELDAYGSWHSDPIYGNVWRPHQLQAGWTPYRNGHWTWIDPWGWNWVDDAPWGYAVSHYGRWSHVNGVWGWVPGPRHEQAVFAPALVVFLGGKDFQSSRSGDDGDRPIGWFPLAPREVYQPAYKVSRPYFDRVNRSNAVIAPTTLTNVYQSRGNNAINTMTNVPKVVYVNQNVAGAVVALPKRSFTDSRSLAKPEPVVSKESANRRDLTPTGAIAPVTQSINASAPQALAKPPSDERRIVAPKERPLAEPRTDVAKAAPMIADTSKSALLKSFPVPTDTARKPAPLIPALQTEGEHLKAARPAPPKGVEPAKAPHARASASEHGSDRKHTREDVPFKEVR